MVLLYLKISDCIPQIAFLRYKKVRLAPSTRLLTDVWCSDPCHYVKTRAALCAVPGRYCYCAVLGLPLLRLASPA